MDRRAFLALSSGPLSVGLAGCRGGRSATETPAATRTDGATWGIDIPDGPPAVDCDAASRPMPAAVDRGDALPPREYPERPVEPLTGDAAVEYATAFERAYRQNEEMVTNNTVGTASERDRYLTRFDLTVLETWVATDDGRAVVRLRYSGSGTVYQGSEFDYVTQFVTYYVDQSLVVRARTTRYGFAGPDELSPDPWADGDPVACFDA